MTCSTVHCDDAQYYVGHHVPECYLLSWVMDFSNLLRGLDYTIHTTVFEFQFIDSCTHFISCNKIVPVARLLLYCSEHCGHRNLCMLG
jgi:hypothetical protein